MYQSRKISNRNHLDIKGEDMSKEYEDQDFETEVITETESYLAWRADEPDGESTFHLELNNLTVHFFAEEWKEFLQLAELLLEEQG
jgi:hypothetical protein